MKRMIIDSNVRIGEDVSQYFSLKHSPEDQIALMDEFGIDKAVIIPHSHPPGTMEA